MPDSINVVYLTALFANIFSHLSVSVHISNNGNHEPIKRCAALYVNSFDPYWSLASSPLLTCIHQYKKIVFPTNSLG